MAEDYYHYYRDSDYYWHLAQAQERPDLTTITSTSTRADTNTGACANTRTSTRDV